MSSPSGRARIAIVAPALAARGGLASVALFLHHTAQASGRYEPHLISLATSSVDNNSVRLVSPRTWSRRPRITSERLGDLTYQHVGSAIAEIEPLRYRPHAALTKLLDSFDLVQLVAGTPALAHVARDVQQPVALQCATMVSVERLSLLQGRSPRTAWRSVMTAIVARMDETGVHHADIIQVENAWMRERMLKAVGPARVRFCPPGVDTALFHPDGGDPADMILAVGRLDDPRKNIAMLIEAFALAQDTLPRGVRLVLAGERPPGDDIFALARQLGVANRIDVRLALPAEELAALYRRAAVFALSSNEEGLALVALEAMASGVPVVCTRCGGPETSVVEGETGFLVPLGDARAMADRLVALMSDEALRRRMGRAARDHTAEHFSLTTTGNCFLATYAELLG